MFLNDRHSSGHYLCATYKLREGSRVEVAVCRPPVCPGVGMLRPASFGCRGAGCGVTRIGVVGLHKVGP